MSTIPGSPLNLNPATAPPPVNAPVTSVGFPYPPTDLPSEDGENLESDWHRKEINLLVESIQQFWKGRTDFYVGGNMFIYFSEEQARNRDFRGPDFYVVKNVDGTRMRPYWATWLEGGRYPNLIVELTSPTSKHLDLGIKKDVYQNVFQTKEYFCYDYEAKELLGWRLIDSEYQAIVPDVNGRLMCTTVGLTLGRWLGWYQGFAETWLRFYDMQGKVVPYPGEAEFADADLAYAHAEKERERAEQARERAEKERERAERERENAERERNRAELASREAEEERRRREALEAEIARLKAELEANKNRD